MGFASRALCLSLVMVTCLQLQNAQTVSDRCLCPITSTRFYSWNDIKEFSVTKPKSHCNAIELILTLKKAETEEKIQRCLDTKTKQAKLLKICWNRKNKDGSKETVKLSECGFSKCTERK
ncbi:hypothetical protein P4O66_021351 [Electrophorus voltai]|uniref:Chemokine interleukin-8-like domain-containing protein n=1 Tax=Electrophorus voltai TaxID=2609070 RepID=A0AAD8ZPD4_9TELE|nr:hypothetical protein P4O66_021351 [Electrophorus voltai]